MMIQLEVTMKKLLVMLLSLSAGAALLSGCSGNGQEAFEEKSYAVDAAEIAEVSIDVRDRTLAVSLSPDDQIHIGYYESDTESYDIAVSEAGVLTMAAVSDKNWTDYIGGKAGSDSRTISLQIPDGLLPALTLSTTNEDISLPALHITDRVSLTTNGGDITFAQLDAGSAVTLKAKNGDIRGAILGSYDDYAISCEIKKGDSSLPAEKEGGEKTLSVSNNNGDIDIDFVRE